MKQLKTQKLIEEVSQNTKASQTKRKIIAYYVKHGPATTAAIAKYLNYSVPTVSKIIADLEEKKLIQRYGKKETSGGRQPMLFGLHAESGFFIGVDVQHDHVNLGLIDITGEEKLVKMDVPFDLVDEPSKIDELCALIDRFIGESKVNRELIMNININLPGRINPLLGRSATFFNDSETLPLAQQISEKLGLFVTLDNDTRGLAFGEYTYGEYDTASIKNALYVNFSWGLGMGIIINGEIYTGHSGYSGELGHISQYQNEIMCHCGKKGCLQTEVSGLALQRTVKHRIQEGGASALAGKVLKGEEIKLSQIIDAINHDDILCIEALEDVAKKFGKVIAGLINVFNPEAVIIGGSLARTGEYLRQPIQSVVRTYTLSIVNNDTEICLAKLGEKAGVLGACMIARQRRFEVI